MAELLIRVVDKIHDDFYRNTKMTKRGDVIAAKPDGWPWGKDELNDPRWRIVCLPGISLAQAESFLAEEPEKDPANPSRTLQRRAFKFNLDWAELPADIKAWIADDSRAVQKLTIPAARLSAATVMNTLKVAKAPIEDVAIIG